MSNLIRTSVFLRRALRADALVSTLVGVVLTFGAAALHELAIAVDPSPTPLGQAAGQVIVALLFVELEFIGLRRACAIVAA